MSRFRPALCSTLIGAPAVASPIRRRYCECLGGWVNVESEPLEEAAFSLRLPADRLVRPPPLLGADAPREELAR